MVDLSPCIHRHFWFGPVPRNVLRSNAFSMRAIARTKPWPCRPWHLGVTEKSWKILEKSMENLISNGKIMENLWFLVKVFPTKPIH